MKPLHKNDFLNPSVRKPIHVFGTIKRTKCKRSWNIFMDIQRLFQSYIRKKIYLRWHQSTEANLQLGVFHSFFEHLVKFLVVCIRKTVFPISNDPCKYVKHKSIDDEYLST